MVPELFNPHARSPFPYTVGPTSIRVALVSGTFNLVTPSQYGSGPAPLYRGSPQQPKIPAYVTPNYTVDSFRNGVAPIISGDSASSFSSLLPWVGDTTHGFLVYDYTPSLTAADYYTGATDTPIRATISSDMLMELQYLSPRQGSAPVWRTYDTLCGNEAFSSDTGLGSVGTGYYSTGYIEFDPGMPLTTRTSLAANSLNIISKFDPRSSRLGAPDGNTYMTSYISPLPSVATYCLQFHFPFGVGSFPNHSPGIYPGLWAQGGKSGWSDSSAGYNAADQDGTVRPADGWLGSSSGSTNAGPANLFRNVNDTAETAARPVILGRPFRSVAELGYVFRDSPWKTLSFFDGSSGDGALFDLFSVSDEPAVVAGRLELNSAQAPSQAPMQQALLSGVTQSSDGTTSQLASTVVSALAAAYQSYAYPSGASATPGPNLPANAALLPAFMSSSGATNAYPVSTTPLKNYRESVVRALEGGTQTRTWNLLVDVVGQVGRFPSGGTPSSLANFIVEGERRYWLSVAIDRYTGKVVDEHWEAVNE